MKFFLLIPVLALFLSNVPFKMEMSIPADMNEETCAMEMQEQMQCSADEAENEEENCCKKESTCVCIYCFQVLAPVQSISKFRFQITEEKSLNGFYLQSYWSNPFIDGPLQPPDRV
jgi:hypothetical protein